MIGYPITYKDYNGIERTEKHYFNLNESEILELEITTEGGYIETMKAIINSKDQASLMKNFKKIILNSYGIKSPDGKSFMKSEKISNEFACTEAYNVLFMELVTDSEKASKFINGVFPNDIHYSEEEVQKFLNE